MVLVALILSCAAPSFDPSGLAELACASVVETAAWDTLVDGVSLQDRRDLVLGQQSFLNLNTGEFFDAISVELSASGELPAIITWEGEDCPGPELRVPLEGSWDIAGTDPSECACVLDQAEQVRCVGGIFEDQATEERLREYGPDGAGLFIHPPLILDWDTLSGTASAEIWLEFQVWESWAGSETQQSVIEMHDLEHQPQE